jgi:hypothetical protein
MRARMRKNIVVVDSLNEGRGCMVFGGEGVFFVKRSKLL